MLLSTQQKIVKVIYRAWNDVGCLLGRKGLIHDEGVRLAIDWFGPEKIPISLLLHTIAIDALPSITPDIIQGFQERLSSLDTEQKLEEYLLRQPEPTPEQLDEILTTIDGVLSTLGKLLTERASQFPHRRGGRPEKIVSPEERRKIKEEITRLRVPNTKLTEIFARVSERHDNITASQVKQIWYEDKVRAE